MFQSQDRCYLTRICTGKIRKLHSCNGLSTSESKYYFLPVEAGIFGVEEKEMNLFLENLKHIHSQKKVVTYFLHDAFFGNSSKFPMYLNKEAQVVYCFDQC